MRVSSLGFCFAFADSNKHGPLLGKMLSFALPLMLSGVLQLLFNAADMVVAGRFAGSEALAAVGFIHKNKYGKP